MLSHVIQVHAAGTWIYLLHLDETCMPTHQNLVGSGWKWDVIIVSLLYILTPLFYVWNVYRGPKLTYSQTSKKTKTKQNHTHLYTSLSWHLALSVIPLAKVSDSDGVVFGAKTLSFCSLTFDRVSIPPDWFLLLHHLCLHFHLFPLSFLSSLFVEALTRMRREPLKMSADASRCLSSALGIDLCGQFVAQGAKTLMRSSAASFEGLNWTKFSLTVSCGDPLSPENK